MIHFFKNPAGNVLAVQADRNFSQEEIHKLIWLFNQAQYLNLSQIEGIFVGPRREMITPWSTNAVEMAMNLGLKGIDRIEEFTPVSEAKAEHDPMLQRIYKVLDQEIFSIHKKPEPILYIRDIAAYNEQEGLALSPEEIDYLEKVSKKIGRHLSDSEVFGFSQVNSEHCRHKIFNGIFVIDGEAKEDSLFKLIRKTSETNPNQLVSAYKDNVAFNQGPRIEQFAPASGDNADFFETRDIESVISLKAETHNFPTTVEPFNGASTGTGGEIRDRLGGGKASLPIAGTAVYMTSYARNDKNRSWEQAIQARPWLYQTPEQILIKASNGASDFGNKFGQPLICGSLLTFEHEENQKKYAYDKVIMLAGGVGYANKTDALKEIPRTGQKIVVLGGDNYRIGMGGGAVSSVDTGKYSNAIELNAVQRANPEMQKRVSNVIRALAESDRNPIVSIHDHGAGGHLNCLSELVESTGGIIEMDKLPIGDPTLSAKEIIGNESQERMGLLVNEEDLPLMRQIADRERAPMYVVGETTGDMRFVFKEKNGDCPIDMQLDDMFGKPPRTVITDQTIDETFSALRYDPSKLNEYIEKVLQLEAVACKDWLTNKVDRSVTGKVARQQCAGEIQLPVCDLGAVALDYRGKAGIATSIGHAPQAALVDPEAGSVLAIAEALTNIVWAPLSDKLAGVSLSANWMWPCKNPGEDARLYKAVQAASDFAIGLGINIPTGKDSLSMTQQYDKEKVFSPGTVIISAGAEVSDIRKIVTPVLKPNAEYPVYFIDFSADQLKLGGSALAQSLNKLGREVPQVKSAAYFRAAFNTVQSMLEKGLITAGHDVSAGGLVTALLEMCFPNAGGGLDVDLNSLAGLYESNKDLISLLFAENPSVLIQVSNPEETEEYLTQAGIRYCRLGNYIPERNLNIQLKADKHRLDIDALRDIWYRPSYLLDRRQSGEKAALERYTYYKNQALEFNFGGNFQGTFHHYGISPDRKGRSGIKAAIIREKGVNGDREMAYSLHLAGFDVKDVHMTDLMSGRETLEEINMIVFVGGFSNSDVLGSAKGWAGGFLFNPTAKKSLDAFYARPDTLSLGICNGCQCMVALDLIYPEHQDKPNMLHNDSHKFESEFVTVAIPENHSVMFGSLAGNKLGIWIAHGEGKFDLPYTEDKYHIVAKYNYDAYPANPNGSKFSAAGLCSADGRHLAMMPHLERAVFPWQWAHYPAGRNKTDEVTPWIEAFVNAREWIEMKKA
ncbi:MAG: phosphoribosylformylglycinamidine synthase [Bacteroidales bacterium]|nr:phosphoribosylformylglycinamidine synthase [Bacteroidales bacterium]